jgi:hypothetical protein
MNRTLQWKVITLLGYITALVIVLVMCSEEVLPAGSALVRVAAPL